MFELQSVSKSYAARIAVAQTSFDVPRGETTILIGPSGCGKSTLLRLMIGLIEPDSGQVRFAGESLTPENVLLARRRMGYVIQDGGLFPHLTARDNATLMARFLKWPRERIAKRIEELAHLTHFPHDGLDRYPAQLSGGQRQRVSVMRALMLDPDVLLLDEPLGALDPMIRSRMQADLREIFRTLQKTVVMVTHDLAEAAYFAHTIVLMRAGRVLQRGSIRELLDAPADPFVRAFVQAQRRPYACDAGGGE